MLSKESTLFTRIIERELPADILHEDDQCIVIRDIMPQASVHFLVIPKNPIPCLSDANSADQSLLGHLLLIAVDVARRLGVGEGFRLVVNNGEKAGQTVPHLHLHILADSHDGLGFSEASVMS